MTSTSEWMTTNPHPTSPAHQIGWRLHYVRQGVLTKKHPISGDVIDVSPALCGITPKHGWGLDSFVNMYCATCEQFAVTDHDEQKSQVHRYPNE